MVRLLIAGAGMMGSHHASRFSAMENVEVWGCVDHHADRAEQIARKLSLAYRSTSLREALETGQPDGVVVAVSDPGHFEVIETALDRGCAVFCEKPLCAGWEESASLYQRFSKSNHLFVSNFSKRNAAASRGVKTLLEAGAIGQPVHFEFSYFQGWIPQKTYGEWHDNSTWLWRIRDGSGGVLSDLGSHLIDLMLFYFGMPGSLSCSIQYREKGEGLGGADSFVMSLDYPGMQGTLQASWWSGGHRDTPLFRIYGTDGWLEMDLESGRYEVQIHTPGNSERISFDKPLDNAGYFVEALEQGAGGVSAESPSRYAGLKESVMVDFIIHTGFESHKMGRRMVLPRTLEEVFP